MQGYQGAKATDQYLVQRVQAASPEQLIAILLEGGQKYLNLVLAAMSANDIPTKARHANRVSDIILELNIRLNREEGGELVANLGRIYERWMDVLFEATRNNQPARLELVKAQMGELRGSWEECHQKKVAASGRGSVATSLDEMVV